MNFQERKRQMLEVVQEAGSLSVFELAARLGSSPATIRRDLHQISGEGLLMRTHGGAMWPETAAITNFKDKNDQNLLHKQCIAAAAASFVQENDIIFMDCGSTVFQMCQHLKKMNGLRIITNSLPVISELIDCPGITINLVGGELDKARKAIHGQKAVAHIAQYHATKAFIGVDGLSATGGLTAHSEHEATITEAYINNADQVMLLCDSGKIGRDSYLKFADLSVITCLFSDERLSGEAQQELHSAGLPGIIIG